MQHIVETQTVFDEVDLVTPTSTQKYPLGKKVRIREAANSASETASTATKEYIYVKASAALTAKGAYVITPSGTAGAELGTGTPATSSVAVRAGIAPVAFTSGYFGFLQIEGDASIVSYGAVTAGDTLKLINTSIRLADEAGTTPTAKTIGIAKANAATSALTISAYLVNQAVTV